MAIDDAGGREARNWKGALQARRIRKEIIRIELLVASN